VKSAPKIRLLRPESGLHCLTDPFLANHYRIITISLSNHYIMALLVSSIVSNLVNKEGFT
jgi:hypothetical protein